MSMLVPAAVGLIVGLVAGYLFGARAIATVKADLSSIQSSLTSFGDARVLKIADDLRKALGKL